jgi:hypothetical protein
VLSRANAAVGQTHRSPVVNPPQNNWIPSAVAATFLVSGSILLMRSHLRTWRQRRSDPEIDQGDLLHYSGQFRRRMQASGLLGFIGILIAAGDILIPWQRFPALWALFWGTILLITGYLILLAIADALATAGHTRAALARVRAQRRQLERDAAELREKPQQSGLPVD